MRSNFFQNFLKFLKIQFSEKIQNSKVLNSKTIIEFHKDSRYKNIFKIRNVSYIF